MTVTRTVRPPLGRSFSLGLSLSLTLGLSLAAAPPASAQQQNWRPTRSHAPDASGYTAGADMRSGETIQVAVSLQLREREALDAFAASLASGQTTTPLSSEQFLARYAPTAADVAAVVKHLSQSGFVNIEVSSNNLLVTADGSAGTARSAFNVEMRHYSSGGRDAYANTNDPVVPQALSGIVLAVHGLQTVHMAHPAQIRAQTPAQAQSQAGAYGATGANGGANGTGGGTYSGTYASAGKVGHSPTAWPAIYGASVLPTAAKTSIGIITAGRMTQTLTDLSTFASGAGYAQPAVSVVTLAGASRRQSSTASSSTDNTAEWNIDSQNALGAAGGAVKSIIFYAANSLSDADLTIAFNAAVAANTAKVISVSLGECETNARLSGAQATDDQIFLAAAAQGQTFVVASGDSGSYECGGRTSAQSYPAVSPYVIAVGGTSLTTDAAGAWSGETVWACSNYSTCASNGGTGGGASTTEAAPSWQLSSKVLGTATRRGVPDIAFAGDPATGAITIVNGKNVQYGGTSLSAPIFAGFWARLQSANNNKLAFPGPALYKYGVANTALFRDVTSGGNGGYAAAKGWDYTTGFGSLNMANFAAFITANGGF